MRPFHLFGLVLLLGCLESEPPIVIRSAARTAEPDFTSRREVRRIGFGGCAGDACSLTLLDTLAGYRPDVFIWLGDNVYINQPDSLSAAYARLAADSSFLHLKSQTRMLATWDDGDFGEESIHKDAFLNFWDDPVRSVRRQRDGVYASYLFDGARRDVFVILLDTRTFRTELDSAQLELRDAAGLAYMAEHLPNPSPDSTVLGKEQWAWLKAQLSIPCDIRVIATSMPFGPEYNGLTGWANFPIERKRMLAALGEGHAAERTVFVSGVAHYGEVSRLDSTQIEDWPKHLSALYDITSSSLSSTPGRPTENAHRVGRPVATHNVGLIEWHGDADVTARLLSNPPEAGEVWELNAQ